MVTKDVYNHAKNGLDISNTPSYIQYADLLKKNHENVSDLTSFLQDLGLFSMLFFSSNIFSQYFNSRDIIS